MKLLTVTPNASIDVTMQVASLDGSGVQRSQRSLICGGGKGVNVAQAFVALGGEAIATGFFSGPLDWFQQDLRQRGIQADFIGKEGEPRVCLTLLAPGLEQKYNDPGQPVTDGSALLNKIASTKADCVALCGSLPPGLPDDFYLQCADAAGDAFVAIDTSGPALRTVVKNLRRGRSLIKANAEEFGGEPPAFEQCMVTRGGQGLDLYYNGAWTHFPAPEVHYTSAVGSGDAALGAYLWALSEGKNPLEAAKWAVAAGAANAATLGAGQLKRADVEALM